MSVNNDTTISKICIFCLIFIPYIMTIFTPLIMITRNDQILEKINNKRKLDNLPEFISYNEYEYFIEMEFSDLVQFRNWYEKARIMCYSKTNVNVCKLINI